jgi:hypothetical protein
MASEPLLAAAAHHAQADVTGKLKPWFDELTAWSSAIVSEFCRHIIEMPIPDGLTFEDAATARADWLIHQWIQGRQEYTDRITGNLNPDTIAFANIAGKAGELGDLIGTLLDRALRDLDTDLRAAIEDAKGRR